MRKTAGMLLAAMAFGAVGGGCAANKTLHAEDYFERGLRELQEGAYEPAIQNFRDLLDHYPFSDYAEEAELRIAHAHYLAGNCREAIAAFGDFQRQHPTSPHLPMVSYLIGRCYEKEMRPPDRDQSSSQNAHAAYIAVIEQYPDSPFAELAREDLARCRQKLAEHELTVARFYARMGHTKAAEERLLDLVGRYRETEAAARALLELGRLYREAKEDHRASLAFAAVAYHWPEHRAASAARAELSELAGESDLPAGDPLVVLFAMLGRDLEPAHLARAGTP